MDKLKAAVAYADTIKAGISQRYPLAAIGEWFRMEVPAEEAIRWIKHNFTPDEARPLREAGMTPELAAAGETDDPLEAIAQLADQGIITKGADLSALDES